jgi:O-methyltransferase involved in polyketide biosynthesis
MTSPVSRRRPAVGRAGSLADALPRVSSTLAIPLAARAHGDAMFPNVAVHDRYAADALRALGDDGRRWLDDRATVYGVLARTCVFRDLAQDFFGRHRASTGVSLGCGLTRYFQWLDNGTNRFINVDLPEVVALRKRLWPEPLERERCEAANVSDVQWWSRLGLPERDSARPVFVFAEGLLMYLERAQVLCLLREFGTRAPAGSELVFDIMSWLAAGHAYLHPSVKQTLAEFRWGPRSMHDLTAPHARLRLLSEHDVLEGYGFPYAAAAPMFRWFAGVPLYGVVRLGVD